MVLLVNSYDWYYWCFMGVYVVCNLISGFIICCLLVVGRVYTQITVEYPLLYYVHKMV